MRTSLASLVVLAAFPVAAEEIPAPRVSLHESPVAALTRILDGKPRVVAFGEYHEVKGGPKVRSAIRRFSDDLLATVAPRASDLVVETWLSEGNCGKTEEKVVQQVAKTTERPKTTESEIVTLVKKAKAAGVTPWALNLSCADYKEVQEATQAVNFEKLLRMTRDKLQERIEKLLAARKESERIIAVYGGALHNDLHPKELFAPFAFGGAMREKLGGRYAEVDLYVPEYIDRDEGVKAEPWYGLYARQARKGKTVLVERGPGSYIIVFARTR